MHPGNQQGKKMSDTTPILATYKDGALHLLRDFSAEELRGKEIRVIVVEHAPSDESKREKLKEVLIKLRDSAAFSELTDIIDWQKKEREDREFFSGQ